MKSDRFMIAMEKKDLNSTRTEVEPVSITPLMCLHSFLVADSVWTLYKKERQERASYMEHKGGRSQPQERKGPDMPVELEVSLEDLYNGATVEVDISKQVVCDHCHGSGARRSEDIQTCPVCHGRGMTVTRVQLGPGMVQQFQQTCDRCGGKGKTIKTVCPACGGQKVRRGNEQYTLIIEKGMQDGQTLVCMSSHCESRGKTRL